jgi:hypothetical protein
MVGMNKGFSPKFLRRYLDLYTEITGAVSQYVKDVKDVNFLMRMRVIKYCLVLAITGIFILSCTASKNTFGKNMKY